MKKHIDKICISEYKEFEEKSKNRKKTDENEIMKDLMKVFEEFGTMKEMDPASKEAQEQLSSPIRRSRFTATDRPIFENCRRILVTG